MEVSNMGKLLGSQSAEEHVQSFDTMILPLQVCLHKPHVRCETLKERSGKAAAQHRDPHIRILMS